MLVALALARRGAKVSMAVERQVPLRVAPSISIPPRAVSVKLSVMDDARFQAVAVPFDQRIIDIFKAISTRLYEKRLKTVPLVQIESIPEYVIKLLNKPKSVNAQNLEETLDGHFLQRLFPYQRRGIVFGVERGGRILLADEMGLGKTVQAIGIALHYKAEWPLLIVCPSSVKYAWQNEIERVLRDTVIVTVIEKNGDPLPSRHCCNSVVIMSYDQMTFRDLTGTSFHILIFDESHMLKDRKAKRTIVASSLAKNAQRVLLLSGTPALSRPAELFTQLRLLDSKTFHSFVDFAMRYCDGRQGRFGLEAKGCTNSTELAVILQRTCMIRRLKKDVLNDLPAKRRTIVYLPPSDIETRLAALRSARTACSSVSQGNEHALLMSYYAETGTAKANSVSKHIVEQFFGDEEVEKRKIIVFAHHAIVLDTLCMSLAKKAIRYIRIDGSTIGQRRSSLVQQFQNNPETLCAVLSVTAAGLGITLTAASVVIFAELHWNPGILIQAEDRAHRVGQHDSVCCQYMLAEGTADDQIWPLVQSKLDVLNLVKLSADSFRDTKKSRLEPCPSEQQTRLTSFFERLAADDQQQPDCKRPKMDD